MRKQASDAAVYGRVVDAFKRKRDGATPIDIVGMTGLPLEQVKEAVPAVADEYGARLRVTESGEILYSFPDGFKSRYKGFGAGLKRFLAAFSKGAAKVGAFLFKVWIAVMLVGYFALFMLIALVALVASLAGNSSSSDSRDDRRDTGVGLFVAAQIFDLIIRLWFYSELIKSIQDPYGERYARRPAKKPLHKAVFSFVFGENDPNADWDSVEGKAFVSFAQSKRGVISLPEFMAFSGKAPAEAERSLTSYLVEFKGSPEATDEGTIVYRFDELMRRTDTKEKLFETSAPRKRTKKFSANPNKLNGWFIAFNGINLLFGLYFLVCSVAVGPVVPHVTHITGPTYLYAIAYILFDAIGKAGAIPMVLGAVPVAFAALFYAIPFVRSRAEKAENEKIKTENLRKEAFAKIWNKPAKVRSADFSPVDPEAKPDNLAGAKERMIVEMGSYAKPDVEIAADGAAEYRFPALEAERAALEAYRATVDPKKFELGATVFDSHK